MRTPLFDFQIEAKEEVLEKIAAAHTLLEMTNSPQIISFSAPTGAGKTIIMTSLFEDILFGTSTMQAEPNAIFVWLSDMPDLNEQSKEKIESKSDRIQVRQLITIDANFDQEHLEPGNIYFLNTQKLGTDKLLTQKSDKRQNTIWETLTNTARRYPDKFYVVIDEAHRGMNRGANATKDAQSIMQKFILGSPDDGLNIMPLIIGVTATPQRFQALIGDTTATVHKVIVKPEDVIESGLLKDRVILHYPDMAINAEMTMFHSAAVHWKSMCESWNAYCINEKLVKPVLVVQVDDKTSGTVTNTDIGTCLELLVEELGRPLVEGEVVHTFNDIGTLQGFEIPIKKIEPSRIEDDDKILMVFFKKNLSTGWDCPRAEVMMSFRAAQDYTYIAQLLGRMVRTPLAHRIEMDAALNTVHLFLPYFNQDTVKDVIRALREDGNVAATEAGTDKELVTLFRNPTFEDVFDHMHDLVTYKVEGVRKQSNLRRLDYLSVLLSNDEVSIQSRRDVREKMSTKVTDELNRIKSSGNYDEIAKRITGVNLQALELNLGTNEITPEQVQAAMVSDIDINVLYRQAEKIIGDYICKQYRVENIAQDQMQTKIELIVIANDVSAMDSIEKYAGEVFDQMYNRYSRDIHQLRVPNINKYERLASSGNEIVAVPWRAPHSIAFNCSANARHYPNHLFVDTSEGFKTELTSWEDGVIQEELRREDFITWLRNLDRKPWSIEVPYQVSGIYTSMYPDLLIVRKDRHGYVFDLIEPHDPSRKDNYPKAKGLAEFAQKHALCYGRIQLVRKTRGSDGAEHYYRLDVSNITIMRKVIAINSNEELDRIFDTEASTIV